MALFRKRETQVIKRSTTETVETRKVRRIGGQKVEVKRVETKTPPPSDNGTTKQKPKQKQKHRDDRRQGGQRNHRSDKGPVDTTRRSRPPRSEEIIIPTESLRKQMLVRVRPHQTQVVILEGPQLVEHYVATADRESVVGNIYLGRVRNVLPGMEAAFVDFGAAKNGVVYASDVKVPGQGRGKKKPRIEEVIKEGDEILVQVVKDAMGAKGARLTGQPSLPGRYLVLVPDSDAQGISRRLPDNERQRLREVISKVKPKGFGVIVRTAALHASDEEIAADISRLHKTWEKIVEDSKGGGAPRAIYSEPDLLIRVIREHFTGDFKRMLIDDPAAYEKVVSYLGSTAPDLVSKVSHYQDELALFERYHVEDQLRKALDRRVYLPSGGHLVIDRTEALTVIDVNTGKFVGSNNLEDTVLQNNIEAAEEIGRQLRLRDIGGIIVIDFIDMETEKNQQKVLRSLRETLARDRTRTQVFDVSHLGLVEMTRKNVSAGLLETFSHKCDACEGRGLILHEEAAAQAIPLVVEEDVD